MTQKLFGLNKRHLSYSAINLWLTSPTTYRKRYYDKEPQPETEQMKFGKRIATMLEKDPDNKEIAHIPKYPHPELAIQTIIEDVPVVGYVDSYDPHTHAFYEYKTGHTTSKGKDPWDTVKVHKHLQLLFYSLLIETVTGKVKNKCSLIWIETQRQQESETIKKLKQQSGTYSPPQLKLTGRVEKFDRIIYKADRKRMRKKLLAVAKEIRLDYAKYK